MPNYATPTAVAAVLDIPAGRIQLIADDHSDTSVEIRPANPSKSRDVKLADQTRVDFADGVLRVEATTKNQFRGPSGTVEVTVRLPAGSRVEAKAASADFRTVGRFGEVTFEAAQGAVDIDEAAGVRVVTSAGDVSVGRLTGPAEISTAKGDIHVAEAVRGQAVLTTRAGLITAGVAAGVSATLDAGTDHGRIHNALKNSEGAEAAVRIRATTAYGDITARSL